MTNKPVIQSIIDGVYQDLLINPNGGNVSINTEYSEGYQLNVNGTLKTKDITINGGSHNNVLSTNAIDGSFTLNGQPLGARIYKIDELLSGTFSSEDISNSVNAYVGKNLLQRVTAIETTGSQPQFNGTGFVKVSGSTISYDNSTYSLSNHTHNHINGVLIGDAIWDGSWRKIIANGYNLAIQSGDGSHALQIGYNGSFQYDNQTIWHNGNFNPANYLPIAGGTLTGGLTLNSSTPTINFNSTALGRSAYIGMTDGANMYVSAASNGNLYLGSSTTTYINGYASITKDLTVNGLRIGASGILDNGSLFLYDNKLHIAMTSGGFSLNKSDNSVNYFYVTNTNGNANFGYGETDQGYKLAVNGNALISGSLNTVSTINTYAGEALRMISDAAYISGYNSANTVRQGYLQFTSNTIYISAESGSGDIALINKNAVIIRNDVGGEARIQLQGSQAGVKQYYIKNSIQGISNTGFSIRNASDGTTPFYIDGSDNSFFKGNVKIGIVLADAPTSTPACFDSGRNYSNGKTKDKLKFKLYDGYGFTVGSDGDVQYHSNVQHQTYIDDNLKSTINSTGLYVNGEIKTNGNSVIHSGNIGNQTVSYATNAGGSLTAGTSLKVDYCDINTSASAVQFYQSSSNNSYNDNPTGSWATMFKMSHGDGNTYYNRRLAFPFWGNDVYVGGRTGGSETSWEKLIHSKTIGTFWTGTKAEFDALSKDSSTMYIII